MPPGPIPLALTPQAASSSKPHPSDRTARARGQALFMQQLHPQQHEGSLELAKERLDRLSPFDSATGTPPRSFRRIRGPTAPATGNCSPSQIETQGDFAIIGGDSLVFARACV